MSGPRGAESGGAPSDAKAKAPPRLVLASRSPRRRELLEEAGYAFIVIPAEIEEPEPEGGETPEAHAMKLARMKAEDAAGRLAGEVRSGAVVLGADTVVDLHGEIIGQPASDDEARAMLGRLSGSRQAVVTGVALLDVETGRVSAAAERTELEMAPLSAEEIDAYVAGGESRGKAGAYAIQETGDRFVRILSGSWTNVVGLPMELLAEMLREFAPGLLPGGAPEVRRGG